jgi:hypothetical protein
VEHRATMSERASNRRPWGWRLWLVACVLFLLAGWQQPDNRAVCFSVAVVFGIIGARQRSERSRT